MNLDNLVISKGIEEVIESIDENFDNSIINGLLKIIFGLFMIIFIFHFWIWGLIKGHWIRFIVILGLWLLLEVSNWAGGGHNRIPN